MNHILRSWLNTKPPVQEILGALRTEHAALCFHNLNEAMLIEAVREALDLTDFDEDPAEVLDIINPQDND